MSFNAEKADTTSRRKNVDSRNGLSYRGKPSFKGTPAMYAFFYVDPRNPEGEIPDIFLYYSEEKEKYGLKPGRYNGHDTYGYQKFHSIRDNKVECIYEFFQLAEPKLEIWHKGSDLEHWKQFSPMSLRDNLRTGETYIDEDSKDTLSYLLDRWSKKVENYEFQKMFP